MTKATLKGITGETAISKIVVDPLEQSDSDQPKDPDATRILTRGPSRLTISGVLPETLNQREE